MLAGRQKKKRLPDSITGVSKRIEMFEKTKPQGDKKESSHEVGNESESKLLDENQVKVETNHTIYRLRVEEYETGPFEELPKHITDDNDDDELLASIKKNLISVSGKEPQSMDGAIINIGALEQLLMDFGYVAFSRMFLETPEKTKELTSIIKSYDFGPVIEPEEDDSDQPERGAA